MRSATRLTPEVISQLVCPVCIEPTGFRYRLEPCLHYMCSHCAVGDTCKLCNEAVISCSILPQIEPNAVSTNYRCNKCQGKIFMDEDSIILHHKMVHGQNLDSATSYKDNGDLGLKNKFFNRFESAN